MAIAVVAVSGVLAGCSSLNSTKNGSGTPAATAGSATASTPAVDASACGPKPGVKATGTPINLGSIDTKQPGTDFSDIQNMAGAYFDCVNANGGVNGHPITYFPLTEQTNPSQIAALAKKLVTTDHVVGIVGSSSIIECSINQAYWKQQGFYVIGAGIAPECWSTPNSASVNMGPRYSSDGATQYALAQKVDKIAFDQSNVPGTSYIAGGPNALAAAAHVQIQDFTENVPITSANSVAIKLVSAAGPNGAVVLNFTPPQALLILQAAQKQGLEDKVKLWTCSTPCNTDFLASSLGPKWDNKLFVNAELTPLNDDASQTAGLFKAILAKYGKNVSGGVGSFSQMGFTDAEIAVHALQTVKGAYTVASVNAAFKAVSNFDTGMLCQGFSVGNYAEHIPNNMDYTVTPSGGKFVQAQGCTLISAVDPQIAAYRKLAGTAPLVQG